MTKVTEFSSKARKQSDKVAICPSLVKIFYMMQVHTPKLTLSPACPFKPWDQSQQTQSHASRSEGGVGDTGEREEPVLDTWRGFRTCSILRTSDGGGDGEIAKGSYSI